jgi:hypothetical protein
MHHALPFPPDFGKKTLPRLRRHDKPPLLPASQTVMAPFSLTEDGENEKVLEPLSISLVVELLIRHSLKSRLAVEISLVFSAQRRRASGELSSLARSLTRDFLCIITVDSLS